jgi:hypothetical protein
MTPPPIQFKHVLAYKRNNNSAPVTMMPPSVKRLSWRAFLRLAS